MAEIGFSFAPTTQNAKLGSQGQQNSGQSAVKIKSLSMPRGRAGGGPALSRPNMSPLAQGGGPDPGLLRMLMQAFAPQSPSSAPAQPPMQQGFQQGPSSQRPPDTGGSGPIIERVPMPRDEQVPMPGPVVPMPGPRDLPLPTPMPSPMPGPPPPSPPSPTPEGRDWEETPQIPAAQPGMTQQQIDALLRSATRGSAGLGGRGGGLFGY